MAYIKTSPTDYKALTPDPDKPGRYPSPLEKYPGFVQFPAPFMYHHFKEWWQRTLEPLKEVAKLDFKGLDLEWEGAKYLLLEFGEWQLSGVPVGDVRSNNVPLEVVNFVRQAADHYLYPQLSPKELRLLLMHG